MCGICGIVHRDPAASIDPAELAAMCDIILHRGPDDGGQHVEPGVGLGSRRLAIVDLSPRGHMPMSTDDGRYHIVYNGEVYNAAELRSALEGRGHTFRSRSDTEVVLQLYAAHGPAMLDQLNGMFAIAIWDSRERTLFLARDRLGIKPLYYVHDGDTLRFASEQKALFAGGVVPRLDPAAWEELVCFRYVAGEATPYAGVRRLLPGHYLLWRDGAVRTRRWWRLAERVAELRAAPADDALSPWYRATFDDAVRLRRISDVPVGVLLSGGLDSGTVAASLAAQAGGGVHSFTVSFGEAGFDEAPLARQVADRWGLVYHDIRVAEAELLPRLLRATWLNDEPLAHGNELHLWAISEHAKPRVTVLLSGEGADETLGGYVRYRPLRSPRLFDAARALVPRRLLARLGRGRARKLARMLGLGSREAFVLYNACEVLPADLHALGVPVGEAAAYRAQLLAEAARVYPDEPMRQAMYLDQHTFLCSLLDRNDRMTMGASIECRVPFLDYRIVERLAAAPSRQLLSGRESKPLLRSALGDRLPASVLAGRKWGFGVPWSTYLRQVPELRAIVNDLPDTRPVCDGPFDRRALVRLTSAFLAGDRRTDALVRQLVVIALWHQACVDSWTPAAASVARP
ncbi:MAG: asparagine synthase (glutamine-hydrolyzing) [Gemmatimonadaceae bacterium]|nr:asparagine synthase (glutamine-hydrolyzing) [Gemmatimonadaceae bacterium]